MRIVALIALCGAMGCLTRYWLSSWVYTIAGRDFPWGTLLVNVIGAFCIGTDQIDLGAASRRGVAVFNAPYSNTRSVVELALAGAKH